jgi:transcriptional regulator with XRE-family HTH domain
MPIYVDVNPVFGYITQMAISGNQLKAARALAGLDQKTLADRADVGINTVRNMEAAGASDVRGRTDTLNAVVAALKAAGVIFVEENGEGPGVRLRKQRKGD